MNWTLLKYNLKDTLDPKQFETKNAIWTETKFHYKLLTEISECELETKNERKIETETKLKSEFEL